MPDSAGGTPLRIAVLVGAKGRGSNLLAIHREIQAERINAHIVCVVGSRPDAPALERAHAEGLPTVVVKPRRDDETGYANALLAALHDVGADTVVLAGYLRRLPSSVVTAFPHRVINIHPSLLPAFGGVGMYGENVHRAVLEYGAKVTGCTVHFVDEHYDTGPVILQRVVDVQNDDTWDTIAARVLEEEHIALCDALRLLAAGRLTVEGRRVCTNGIAASTTNRPRLQEES